MIPEAVPYKVVAGTVAFPAWMRTCYYCDQPTAWLGYVDDSNTPSAYGCETHKADVEHCVRKLATGRTYERAYQTPTRTEVEQLVAALGPEVMNKIAHQGPGDPWWRMRGGVMLYLGTGRRLDRWQIEFCRHRTGPLWDIVWHHDEELPDPLIPAAGDLELSELRSTVEQLCRDRSSRT